MKAGKVIKGICKALVGIVILIVVVVAVVWGKEIATMRTVKQVDGKYLYTMEYKASYDLDDVIEANISSNPELLNFIVGKIVKGLPVRMSAPEGPSNIEVNCTSFQARNADGDGWLYGRNYDYFKNPSMVTISRPKNGYASIAVSDMSHFGYSLEKLPESFVSKALCLAAIYAPVDGINEKGLCTSIMALPKQPAQQNTGKTRISTTTVMRLFLDRCATVDEALELLSHYDVRHDVEAGSGYHYMVADAQGNCAVIEFDLEDGWKTMITRKAEDKNSMLVTNHLLDPKYYTEIPDQKVGNTHSRSWWRYETAGAYLDARNGILSRDEAQECLSEVHWADLLWDDGVTVEDTQYSAVYDQSSIELIIRNWSDYGTSHFFKL
ncbi:MAG: C45 family peptidase [Bacteroidia bacterium]|nr:C45 family peptidase [Bacteroidia bacterium]